MKRILGILTFAFLFGAGNALVAQAKIGYVDFQYIISQLRNTQDVQAQLEQLANDWTYELDAMQDTLELLEKEFETISLTLTPTSRNLMLGQISSAKADIDKFQEQKFSPISGELYKKQKELLKPIIDKIKKSIDQVRIRERYDVVFDISAGNPVSIDRKFDLTSLVLEVLESYGLTLKEQLVTPQRDLLQGGNQIQNQPTSKKLPPGGLKGKTPESNDEKDK